MGWDTCTKYKGVGDHASPSKYMNDFSRLEVQNKFMLKKKNPSVPHQMMTLFDVWISKFFFFFTCFYKMEGYLYKIFALGYVDTL